MIIKIWNVRGLESGNKDHDIREVVFKQKVVDFLGLNKTKLRDFDHFRVQSLQSGTPFKFFVM